LLGTQTAVAAGVGDGTTVDQSFSVSLSADKSEFDRVLSEADDAGLDFENGPPYTARLGGDQTLFAAVVAGAIAAGNGFAGLPPFTATLNADNENVKSQANMAWSIGNQWEAASFTADLNVNDNASGVIQGVINLLNSVPASVTTTLTTNLNTNVTTNYSTTGTPVPARQHGGYVREPLTMVGERGPELVSLPYGSYVHPANETHGMIGGPGRRLAQSGGGATYVTVNIKAPVYGVDNLKASIAEAITQADIEASRQYHRGYAA
jgi:hypothetical protein